MATSFVRGGKSASRTLPLGTRPGLHGQILTSTGVSDLDKILGGGLPLGTLIVVLEDAFAPHHLILLRYFLAQGVQNQQALFFASPLPSPQSFISTLPGRSGSNGEKDGLEISEETAKQSDTQEGADGLRIAWQYRRFISEKDALEARRQRQVATSELSNVSSDLSSATALPSVESSSPTPSKPGNNPFSAPSPAPSPSESRKSSFKASSSSSSITMQSSASDNSGGIDFCCPFDLRKPIDRPTLGKVKAEFFQMRSIGRGEGGGVSGGRGGEGRGGASGGGERGERGEREGGNPSMLQFRCSQFLSRFDRNRINLGQTAGTTGRMAVQSLGAPSVNLSEWEMLTWLYDLKSELMHSQVVTFVTFPPSLHSPSLSMRIQHLADTVISVESLREGEREKGMEAYADALGLLRVHKLPAVNTLVPARVENCAFAMKIVRRRKLILEPLYPLPVDGVPDGGTKSSTKKSDTVSALLCGGPHNATKALDF